MFLSKPNVVFVVLKLCQVFVLLEHNQVVLVPKPNQNNKIIAEKGEKEPSLGNESQSPRGHNSHMALLALYDLPDFIAACRLTGCIQVFYPAHILQYTGDKLEKNVEIYIVELVCVQGRSVPSCNQ